MVIANFWRLSPAAIAANLNVSKMIFLENSAGLAVNLCKYVVIMLLSKVRSFWYANKLHFESFCIYIYLQRPPFSDPESPMKLNTEEPIKTHGHTAILSLSRYSIIEKSCIDDATSA